MSKSVGAFEAKTNLAKLLDRAEKGESITITRRGKPVARLVPPQATHDVAAARRTAARLRALAKDIDIATFDWSEWKGFRDAGRK